jgi:hypothetical protein
MYITKIQATINVRETEGAIRNVQRIIITFYNNNEKGNTR